MKKMSSKEFIESDEQEENNVTLENQDIFDLITNKVVDEPETQVSHKGASKLRITNQNNYEHFNFD